MSRISRNISILYRAERLIAQRRLEVVRNQTGLMVFACVVAGIGLIMLSAAAYLGLSAVVAPALAALLVALANFLVAAGLVAVAGRLNVEKEIAPAVEVRDLAVEELERDVEHLSQEVQKLTGSLKTLHRDPLGSAAGMIVPILAAMLKKKG